MIAVLLVTIAGLVLLYLTRPQFRQVKLSAARFFEESPQAKNQTLRFRLSNLLLSRLFFLQWAVLLILLVALLLANLAVAAETRAAVGVLVAVDTSASMTVGDSWQSVAAEIDALRAHLNTIDEAAVCVSLWRFDATTRPVLPNAAPDALPEAVRTLNPQPLGTDLSRLQTLETVPTEADAPECSPTHLVVITDQSAPTWVDAANGNADTIPVVWRSVGTPQANVGITAIRRVGGGSLGWAGEISVDVAGYDTTPDLTVTLTDASGRLLSQASGLWDADDRARLSFRLSGGGLYGVQLSTTDDYPLDDAATIETVAPQAIRVAWRLPDRTLLTVLGWTEDATNPDVIVTTLAEGRAQTTEETPILLVGGGYDGVLGAQIAAFDDASPLLDNLNFDVAEQVGIRGVSRDALAPLTPVMIDTADQVWFATGENAAYVPGLPLDDEADENLRAFTTTAFFNGLRYLLASRSLPPLYTLTTPNAPTVDGSRIALHPGEGALNNPRVSVGDVTTISATTSSAQATPVWHLAILLAATIALLERYFALFGNLRWRG